METRMFLTQEEVSELTGRKVKSKQISALAKMGIPYFVNAAGRPIVSRAVIEGTMSVAASLSQPKQGGWKSNKVQ